MPAPGHRVMRRPTPQDIELVAARLGRRLVGPLLDRTTAAEGEAGATTDRATADLAADWRPAGSEASRPGWGE